MDRLIDYDALLSSMTTAVVILSTDLSVRYSNAAAEMLLRTSYSRDQGISIRTLLCNQPEELTGLSQCLLNRQSYTQREFPLQLGAGQTVLVDYTVAPFADGDLLLMEIYARDRPQRISREEEMLARQETAKILIRGLAHEVKNPLGGIRGAAQLLERSLPDKELEEYTRIIIGESDRLRNLVDRMLGSHRRPRSGSVNIHEVLQRVLAVVQAEQRADHNAQRPPALLRDYDPSLPEFHADREQLIQAFLNIVRNAFQALDSDNDLANPQITVRTRPLRQYTLGLKKHRLMLRVDIEDNGPGIPADLIENIFYPMVSGRAEGTGLGLAMAQTIISQHGGLIECSSTPGHTLFTAFIPLESGG